MRDEDFEKIVKQSEIKTNQDFIDNLLVKIEKEKQPKASVVFWSLPKITIGFVGAALLSGFLGHFFLPSGFLGNVMLTIAWALLLLFGLNHVLTLHSYKSLLNAKG